LKIYEFLIIILYKLCFKQFFFFRLSNTVSVLCKIAVCIQIYKVSRSNRLWPQYTELFKVRRLCCTSSTVFFSWYAQWWIFQKSHMCQCIAFFHLEIKTEHEAKYLKNPWNVCWFFLFLFLLSVICCYLLHLSTSELNKQHIANLSLNAL
jgi:hypothetical protein